MQTKQCNDKKAQTCSQARIQECTNRAAARGPARPLYIDSMDGGIKVLTAIQALVGVTAVAGGAALAAAPTGRYLAADSAVLAHTPFQDFFVPGILLVVFVGGGGLLAAVLTWSRGPFWQPYATLYAVGLIVFEVVEYLLIGFQFLQAFELVLALIMLLLVLSILQRSRRLERNREVDR